VPVVDPAVDAEQDGLLPVPVEVVAVRGHRVLADDDAAVVALGLRAAAGLQGEDQADRGEGREELHPLTLMLSQCQV
jgi:hypothetical protein